MKKLVLLGSTGSIGTQVLEVIDQLKPLWKVDAITTNKNVELLEKQAAKYKPSFVLINDKDSYDYYKYKFLEMNIKVLQGMEGLNYLAELEDSDVIINALVGGVGLRPSLTALENDKILALANKESMVIGGELINKILKEKDSKILPIDSEHNAIFQLFKKHSREEIKNIILTASGGPFFNFPVEKLKNVTVNEALNHPNWNMGKKISIDSATLMNKGLEVIEAHWLFKKDYENIKVVVHPESIIHSMIELIDNSIEAELGVADMKIPIQNVLTFPKKTNTNVNKLNLLELNGLHFYKPDYENFPALKLAFKAGKARGTMPTVLNASNEIVVDAFLHKKINFMQIPILINEIMEKHQNKKNPNLIDILLVDEWARRKTEEVI